jgi:hypothetical protein
MSQSLEDFVAKLLSSDYGMVSKPVAYALGGAEECLIVKKVFDWCSHNKNKASKDHFKKGFYWTYFTYEDWAEELPWVSERTVMRIIKNLEVSGVLISCKANDRKWVQTKWYRVDFEALAKIVKGKPLSTASKNSNSGSSDKHTCQNGNLDSDKMARSTSCQNGNLLSIDNQSLTSQKEIAASVPGCAGAAPSTTANDRQRPIKLSVYEMSPDPYKPGEYEYSDRIKVEDIPPSERTELNNQQIMSIRQARAKAIKLSANPPKSVRFEEDLFGIERLDLKGLNHWRKKGMPLPDIEQPVYSSEIGEFCCYGVFMFDPTGKSPTFYLKHQDGSFYRSVDCVWHDKSKDEAVALSVSV